MTNIFVAGHKGMVGSAICRQLKKETSNQIITASREELDLTNQKDVSLFFGDNSIDQVYLAAAKVGGILANDSYPAEFIYENLCIQSNIIHSAYKYGVKKLLFLGSSCIYPKYARQPIAEESLLTGLLEPTNEPYAIAKIAGIKLCESYNRQYDVDFRSVMPTNLYGPGDNYHPLNSHVIPALIRKVHEAKDRGDKSVTAWGTGNARREFLFVEDLAKACHFVMNLDKKIYKKVVSPMLSHLNIGYGSDITIKELIHLITDVVGYDGKIFWDSSKPDGSPQKLMDNSKIFSLGWKPKVQLAEGLKLSYQDFINLNQTVSP